MKVLIECKEANCSLLSILQIVKTSFDRLHHLIKEPRIKSCQTHINRKHKRRQLWFSNSIVRWCFEFICSILQLHSLPVVFPLSELIQRWCVVNGNFISIVAEIADYFRTILNESHVHVYICFASVATERTYFTIINQWNAINAICILICVSFCKWLHRESKWYSTDILHSLILRSIYHSASHIPNILIKTLKLLLRRTVSFINADKWNSSGGWSFNWFSWESFRNACSHIVRIEHFDGSRNWIIVYFRLPNCRSIGFLLSYIIVWLVKNRLPAFYCYV
jgi:hypothetical protein